MSAFEGDNISWAQQNLGNELINNDIITIEAHKRCVKFLREWTSNNISTYRNQIMDNAANGRYYVEIELEDLNTFDQVLYHHIRNKPGELLPFFESAAKEVYCLFTQTTLHEAPEFQVQIYSDETNKSFRELKASMIGGLVSIAGIIISAKKTQIKASNLKVRCKNCSHTKTISYPKGFSGISIPRYCDTTKGPSTDRQKCPPDCYVILADECRKVDQQTLKLQEFPEDVPTGEIPRTFQIILEQYLVEKLVPGVRVSLTGIYQVIERVGNISKSASTLKLPFIYVTGYKTEKSRNRRLHHMFSVDEEEQFKKIANGKNVYERLSKCIGSAIYGSEDIKKAIACQLFGGSRKFLPDRTKLRGDINVLLIGDPSTAKSQFLKFVERVAPIAVYTSGKGSSAAGLTASINKDVQTGEFQLEGGAMVLADGGIVCIDEFDKMRAQDRVAIHEAMEQQTISIAKAGINTVLNSRTSVLAAANPIFGRYDQLQDISNQIDLQTTILSRFDLIFIVKDQINEERDKTLANHILDLHIGGNTMDIENDTEMDLATLRKYILYARSKVSPRLIPV